MPLRLISDDERNKLYDIIQDKGNESGYWIPCQDHPAQRSRITVSKVGRGGRK